MKNLIITICFTAVVVINGFMFSQEPDILWKSYFDGSLHREDYFKHMVIDNEGNTYVLCATKGNISNYDQDITTYKINTSGQVVWVKQYNGSGTHSLDEPRDILYDPNGYIICMGRLRDEGIVVIKYDLNGNVQWTYIAPAVSDDIYSIATDNSGNIYLAGTGRSVPSEDYSALFTKLSPGGSELFRLFSIYGGTSTHWNSAILKIIPDGAGNILAVGNCKTTNTNYNSSFVVKFNQSGGENWRYVHITDSVYVGSFELAGICMDNSGHIFAAGYNSQGDNNYNDALVMNLELSNGSVNWIKKVDAGNTGFDHIKSIHADAIGYIYLSTYSRFLGGNSSHVLSKLNASDGSVLWSNEITSFGQTGNGIYTANDIYVEGNGDFYISKPSILYNLTKYNTDGDTLWNKYILGSFIGSLGPSSWMDKYSTTVVKGFDNKLYVGCTGTSIITVLDTTDVMVTCFEENAVSVNDENESFPGNFVLQQNYPNPFNPSTKINFRLSKTGFTSLKVYDVLGNEVTTLVNEELQTDSYEVNFDGTGLPSGVYFYKLQTDKFIESKKMILIK